jgi:hypothetical protein
MDFKGVNLTMLELMHQLYPKDREIELELIRRRTKANGKELKELKAKAKAIRDAK